MLNYKQIQTNFLWASTVSSLSQVQFWKALIIIISKFAFFWVGMFDDLHRLNIVQSYRGLQARDTQSLKLYSTGFTRARTPDHLLHKS